MQEKVNLQVEKEVVDMIELLKEVLPWENGEKLDENEVLKMVLGTFMAFIQGDDEEENGHEHGGCGCGQGHCH